jgi:hypothetical protein
MMRWSTFALLPRLRPLLREPLVHFLLAGLAIFAFFAARGEPVDPASRTIVIDEARVQRLVAGWQQTWQRAPTQAEIDALIHEAIKDEVYYREALRLGLDVDDPGIKRRLRLKMEYLAGAAVEDAVPSDAVLQAWFDRNPARYAADPAISFDQIYLGQDAASAAAVRAALARGEPWRGLGTRLSLPLTQEAVSRSDVARQFGDPFAAALVAQPRGQWAGPVHSGFGQHLVRLRGLSAPAPPRLAEVRQAVENDWRAATLAARRAAAYQALLDGYDIKLKL